MKKGVEAAELEGSGESNNRARQACQPLHSEVESLPSICDICPLASPFTTKPWLQAMARHPLRATRVCAPALPAKTDSMRLTLGLPYPSTLGLLAKTDSMRADRGTGAQVCAKRTCD